jgi:hypothetical protein
MSIFTGTPIKSRIGTKSDVVRCDNGCLSYNGNNGSPLPARCRRGSARHPIQFGPNEQRFCRISRCVCGSDFCGPFVAAQPVGTPKASADRLIVICALPLCHPRRHRIVIALSSKNLEHFDSTSATAFDQMKRFQIVFAPRHWASCAHGSYIRNCDQRIRSAHLKIPLG